MAGKSFAAQVSAWTAKSERRLRAVALESAQRLFDEALTVGPSVANPDGGEGGKHPVDTGFLRSSFQVNIGSMPAGPSRGAPGGSYAAPDYTMKLTGFSVGQTIYGGWTAEYSAVMEHRYGFMRSAAMNWQDIVTAACRDAQVRFPDGGL